MEGQKCIKGQFWQVYQQSLDGFVLNQNSSQSASFTHHLQTFNYILLTQEQIIAIDMSIIIKSNQLNTILYKYLLEAGLTHTAYVMFNEAKLESSLQQFKFDIKSGHLLNLLEKALIFTQIESHVNFGQYNQCLEPFYLLKSHTCKVTEKIKSETDSFMQTLNNNLTECIKRTNAIYNTELVNKNYEQIVYEPRGMNYFNKFYKLKIKEGESIQTQNGYDTKEKVVRIEGDKSQQMAIWIQHDNVIYVTQNDSFGDIIVSKVYPCTYEGQLQSLQTFKLTSSCLVMVFSENRIKIIFNQDDDKTVEFKIDMQQEVTEINPNPNTANILSFQGRDQFFILNAKNMEQILSGKGILRWRGFDEYVLLDEGRVFLKSLLREEPLLVYVAQQTDQKQCSAIDSVQISTNKTFFFVFSSSKNRIQVYTFQKQEPLYIFDFSETDEQINQVIWLYRNEVDYLCFMTGIAVRLWEVELNASCLKIDIQKQKLGNILSIAALQKNTSETFLLVLGSNNLLVSDISNQKIQRIESPLNTVQMQNLGRNSVFVCSDENIYFLTGQELSELFK